MVLARNVKKQIFQYNSSGSFILLSSDYLMVLLLVAKHIETWIKV